ncbi:MAG TPA: hypothetical protein VNZ64_02280 [Candidatus Acidoferrum sp.]|jgi:hypothetical protein|nr:hypothetical protein [Candidatus Acidoferrum sp.]
MKRNPRPWTEQELALLGTRPDAEVAELTGRNFGSVWQKRRALGIAQPALRFRKWTPDEDSLVGTVSDAEIARQLGRTESAVKSRRAILEREQARRETKPVISDPRPSPAALEALGVQPITVPRDPSLADDDRYRLIDGPYYPPRTARGRFLVCQLRGTVKVGGYTDAPIPWPRIWRRRSLVICGDLLRALRTESVYAVSYHWGLSRAIVSRYRQQLSIPRYNPGSYRLFREFVIEASRTLQARAKHSAAREGKPSTESARDRERLRRIQRRPKPKELRRRMSERMRRRFDLVGPYPRWTPEELAMIGTMRDREVARRINRSLSAVRAKKFALRAGFK